MYILILLKQSSKSNLAYKSILAYIYIYIYIYIVPNYINSIKKKKDKKIVTRINTKTLQKIF